MASNVFISNYQYVWMLIVYIMGSTAIVFIGGVSEQSAWLAIILGLIEGMILCLPFVLLTLRFPGMSVSSIHDAVWGKWVGKLFTIAFIFYTLTLASIVVTDFQQFAKLTILPGIPDTSLDVANIVMLTIFCISGIENFARYSSIVVPFIMVNILTITSLALPYMDPNNLRPIKETSSIFKASFGLATFPFGEAIAFAAIIPHLTKPKNALKYTYIGLVLGAVVLLVLNLRNELVLGEGSRFFTYPSYSTAKVINIAGFFTRMELFVAVNHTLSSLIKAVILTFVVSVTLADMLGVKIHTVAVPVVLLITFLCHHNFSSVSHNFEWSSRYYPLYALPFQFGLPFVTLAWAGISKRKLSAQDTNGTPDTSA